MTTVADRLDDLSKLEIGWDGGSAPPPSRGVVLYASELFAQLAWPAARPPSVVPTVAGGVQFEWHTPRKHIELEVFAPDDFVLAVFDRDYSDDGEEVHQDVAAARSLLAAAMQSI